MNSLELVHENYSALYRFVYRMAGNHELAEDIVQETFLRLARESSKDLSGLHGRRWLFVVARNLCISWFRRKSKQTEVPMDEMNDLHADIQNPIHSLSQQERDSFIQTVIASLPQVLREVILLREFEEMNYEEISTIVGCPIGTVKSRIAKAREILKQKLQPMMEAEL
jgi:RNA polymerase sigma-70 factor (ECF subfamily)